MAAPKMLQLPLTGRQLHWPHWQMLIYLAASSACTPSAWLSARPCVPQPAGPWDAASFGLAQEVEQQLMQAVQQREAELRALHQQVRSDGLILTQSARTNL